MSRIILACVLLVCVTSVGADCPKEWKRFKGSSYCLNKNKKNWETAKKYCSSIGAHLVRIESEPENNFLKRTFIIEKNSWVWTDGTDEQKEGHWKWSSTNEPIKYRNWLSSEPNGGKKENYMNLYPEFTWNDARNTFKSMSICELDGKLDDKNYADTCHCQSCTCAPGDWK